MQLRCNEVVTVAKFEFDWFEVFSKLCNIIQKFDWVNRYSVLRGSEVCVSKRLRVIGMSRWGTRF